MPYHNLSATLTDADLQAIKETIAAIKARLPFLITLTTEERRRLFKMGNKSLSFVTHSLTVAQNNPEILPSSLDVAEFSRDTQLATTLAEILSLLKQLTEEVDDTLMAVGSEAMGTSLNIYDYAKTAAKKTPGLKSIVEQLGERFKGLGNRYAKTSEPKSFSSGATEPIE